MTFPHETMMKEYESAYLEANGETCRMEMVGFKMIRVCPGTEHLEMQFQVFNECGNPTTGIKYTSSEVKEFTERLRERAQELK